ncbi:MAG: FeoB-associated Cys-rich membrane protein [Clostridia bacterium]|nr:FeoB-associated Cys-rich membrane protein [Clostridia bacterium]
MLIGYKNAVIVVVIATIVALAAMYIYKAKKAGKKCIGCPDSGSCTHNCGSCGGCREKKE